MSEAVPQEVIDKAREINYDVDEWNRMTWSGGYRDEVAEVVMYVWRMAHEAGYREGCEDSR